MLDISFSLSLYVAFGVMDANRFPIACFDSSR